MTTLPQIVPLETYEAQSLLLLKPQFQSRYGMLRFEDMDVPGDELEWVVDDVLTTGDKSIVGGPSQSGKSFLAIDLGMKIATGAEFFGKKVKQGLVIYQAGEGARGIKNRIRAYRQKHNIATNAKVPFVLLQSRIDLHSPEGDASKLIEEINGIRAMYDEPLRVVFIDTLARAMGGADENSGRDMAVILNNIDMIRDKTGVAICLVHHLNADGTKLRGHTSVFAAMDTVISVTMDAETKIRTMRLSKQKDGDTDAVTVKFELMVLKVGERDGKEVTSCVVAELGQKQTFQGENGERFYRANAGETNLLNALFRALQENAIETPAGIHVPSSVHRVVNYEDVKGWYKRLNIRVDDDPVKEQQRLSQALKRARESLAKYSVIGIDNPYMWHTGKPVYGIEASRRSPSLKQIANSNAPKRDALEDDEILEGLPF